MVKILLVDDKLDMVQDMAWAAQGPEREIITATKEEEAINFILKQDFDVVVTDLVMRANTEAGLAILKAAKDKDPLTQVILVTSYGTAEVSIIAMQLGGFDYLERGSPGTDHLGMLGSKIALALKFRKALISKRLTEEL